MRTLLPLLLMCLLIGCGIRSDGDYVLDETTFDQKAIETVSRVSRIQLPEGVRGLNMVYDASFRDAALIAKLEIPSADIQRIVRQIDAIDGETMAADLPITDGKVWWKPESLTVKTRRSLCVGTDFLELTFGQENTKWILFVKWAST